MATGRTGSTRIRRIVALVLVLGALAPAAGSAQSGRLDIHPQLGHAGPIRAVDVSPDGRRILSAGTDETLKVWDAASGRELRTLKAHGLGPQAAAFSADGRTIVSGGLGKILKLWDVESGRELRTLVGHTDWVWAVAFSPDGRNVASAGSDGTLRLWEVTSGRALRTLAGHGGPVTALAFSPDGRAVVSGGGSQDPRLKLWNVATGEDLRTFTGHRDRISAVAFSPDGRTVMSASYDRTVRIWDAASGRELRTLAGHGLEVWDVAVSPDGQAIVSAGQDGTMKLWDAASGRELRTLRGHGGGVHAVAYAPGGGTIVSAGRDGILRLWDAADGRELRTLEGYGDQVRGIAFSPDGRTIASSSRDRTVKLWEAASGRALRTLSGHRERVSALAYSPDGSRIVATDADGTLKLWDAASARELRTFTGHGGSVGTVAISPDGRTIVAAAWDGTVKRWDAESGRALRALEGHREPASAVAYSPDGRTIASGGGDATVKLWDAASGQELRTLAGRGGHVLWLAFLPDGRTVVSAGTILTMWDVASGREIRSMSGQSVVAVSPDGRAIVTGGPGYTLKVWDAVSGREQRTLTGHHDVIAAVAFAPDGRSFASASWDRTIRRWSRTGDLLATTVSGANGQWVTVTPEGYFDASDEGAQILTVVRGLEAFSIDQAYQVLYRPDLVREKLAGDPRGLVRAAAAKVDLDKVFASGSAPHVALSAAAAKVIAEAAEVSATFTDTGGGVGRVEWRVNGVTLGMEAPRGFDRLGGAAFPRPGGAASSRPGGAAPSRPGGAAPAPAARPQGAASVVIHRSLALAPGENVIELVAYNAANMIASAPARLVVTREGAPAAARPRLHVLAVGINDYRDSRLKLSFATVDARALGDGLKRAGGAVYESVEVTTVLDDGVTLATLDRTFTALAAKVRPDDVFVFFLAGHGKTIDGRYWFLPHDFRYAGDETIVSYGIGQDQWQDWFARIPARKSLLLYDTCESGSLTGDRVAMRGIERVAALERMTRATGRTTLTASTDDAPALEGYRGHGVFTYALLDALGKADGNGDGLVDVTELASFVDTQVPELSFQAFRQRQFPQMKIVGSNFPVVAKAALLPADAADAPPQAPTRPTHVVIAPADVYARADAQGGSTAKLAPGTTVSLLRSEQGWVLVAKDGKLLGYVAQGALAGMQ